MAETIGSVLYEMGVDMRPLKKGITDAEGAFKKSGAAAEQAYAKQGTAAANKLGQSQGLLVKQSAELKKGILAGVGIGGGLVAFNALAAGIGTVVDFMGDAVSAAIEEEKSIALLTRSIEENDEAWDGNIEAIEAVIESRQALAFADDEQRDSLRVLVSVTKSSEEALKLQATAMDLARLRNMSLADASQLLGKVYAGNLSILGRYGIVLEKGATATEALAEIQKRAAGQAATYAETTEGKLVTAQIALDNAMEELGMTLVPVVAAMADAATDIIPKLTKAFEELGDAVAPLLDELGLTDTRWSAWEVKIREAGTAAGMTSDDILDLTGKLLLVDQSMATYVEHLRRAADETERNAALQAALNQAVESYVAPATEAAETTGMGAVAFNALVVWQRKAEEAWQADRAAAEDFGIAVEDVATETFPDVKAAADDARHAINAAFREPRKPLGELLREEERLARQRRRAMAEGRFDIVAMIDARNAEVQAQIRAHRTQNQHYREEKRDREATRGQIRLIADTLNVSRQKAQDLKQQADRTFGKGGWKVNIDTGEIEALEDDVAALDGKTINLYTQTHGRIVKPFAKGGWAAQGQATLVGERGPELRVEPTSALYINAQKTASMLGSRSVSRTSVVVNINAGVFLGRPLDAQRFAQEVAPSIGRELARIGL